MEISSPIARVGIFSKTLSEEIRIRMLLCLQGGPLGLQHFVDIFQLAPSTLSKHLHMLENSGLAVAMRQGRRRLYHWPDAGSDETIGSLLAWLKRTAQDDPSLQTDAARRAVALQANPLPEIKRTVMHILILCTKNSCRSQMAEALLRARGGSRFEVASAGVAPREIPPLTFDVMQELGIGMAEQKSKSVMEFIGKAHFDYLITVCDLAEQQTPVFPGVTHRLHWPMPDPAEAEGSVEEKKQVFRQVRDQLDARISAWIEEVTHHPPS